MPLFVRKKRPPADTPFPPEKYEPVIRCGICTGEQVACMRERESGKLTEIMLLAAPADLDDFCRRYGLEASEIRRIY